MKCRICEVLIDQDEADRAAEIVGPGHETMCEDCARSIASAQNEKSEPELSIQ